MNTVVDTEGALRSIAERIRARAAAHYLEIGRDLAEARGLLRGDYERGTHQGAWHRWLREELHLSPQSARRYIWVFERYGAEGATLELPPAPFAVLAQLAAPEAAPAVVAELERRLRAGERVTKREAAEAIAGATPPAEDGATPPPLDLEAERLRLTEAHTALVRGLLATLRDLGVDVQHDAAGEENEHS